MARVDNLTPFASVALPSMAVDGADVVVVVVSGRFALPRPGSQAAPTPSDEQPPVRLGDTYWGEPAASSLRYEGQTAPRRGATDVHLLGQAWAPRGQPSKRVDVSLVITPAPVGTARGGGAPHLGIDKTIAVFGERVYARGDGSPSAPRPFVSLPLVYERAFGGSDPGEAVPRAFEPNNPVGRGFFSSAAQAADQPVPNLEDPLRLITAPTDRPAPAGFGPIARSWQPRVGFAGTYDQRWVEERAPSWPDDFDERFYQASPLDLQVRPHLSGGERVALGGVSPDGTIHFELPALRVQLKSHFHDRVERQLLVLDSLSIEPDDGVFTLTWRASEPLPRGIFELEHCVVRLLEPWEDGPAPRRGGR